VSRAFSAAADVPADVPTAWRTLTGPSWPQALAAALHDGSELRSAEATADGGVVLVVSRRLPDGVPGFIQRFLPKDGRVTQTDAWGPVVDGVARGTWEVSFPGSPGEIRGEMTLAPAAGRSTWSVTGTVSIQVPLVGGRIEGYLAPLAAKLVARQAEVLREQVG